MFPLRFTTLYSIPLLQGPGGSYLQHIERTTGVSAVLAGRGSGAASEGPEPVHVRVTSQEPHALLEAVK